LAWASATSGESTRSPRTGMVGSTASGLGGMASSMGKDRTSVGPVPPIQRRLSSVMWSRPTTRIESSASGLTPISASANPAAAVMPASSTSWSDSLMISMPTVSPVSLLGVAAFGVPALVGVHDIADQLVPDDVLCRERGEVHVVDALEDVAHDPQSRGGAARQVDLGDVAGDDDLRAEAEPREEHLHLLGGGVLRLVQDDERVVQRPAAHVRQGRDLDGAGLHELGDGAGVEHVVQRVVERAQVRVDLLAEGAGEEAELLAGLDGGPGEDDPGDLFGLEGLHGLGHGQVGL